MKTILLTDVYYKHSWSIQRVLARLRSKHSLPLQIVGYGGARNEEGRHPKNSCDQTLFNLSLEEAIERVSPDLILPVGGCSMDTCIENQYGPSTLPALENYRTATSKDALGKLAAELGLFVPKTIRIDNMDFSDLSGPFFPCVLKPLSERQGKAVFYPQSLGEMKEAAGALLKHGPVLLQERIVGPGYGFCAYYQNGAMLRSYQHRRKREMPVSGGASTSAITVDHPELLEYGQRLLDALDWNGVGMVEFKRCQNSGKFYLIEVNAKFWGSFELSIRCHAGFVSLILNRAFDFQLPLQPTSTLGTQMMWPFDGDLSSIWKRRSFGDLAEYIIRPGSVSLGRPASRWWSGVYAEAARIRKS